MKTEQPYVPDWDRSSSWDEHDWEQALKYSDHLAARYFRMLERFGDLPDGEEFIMSALGDQSVFEFEEPEFFGSDDPDDWDPEDSDLDDDDDGADGDDDDCVRPGDSLYFENSPVYQRARQLALGWCNILASVLGEDDRFWGMQVLFHFGRLLSYIAISVGDGRFERLTGSVAFAKRALQEVNVLLGEVSSEGRPGRRYAPMFRLVREHLLETHDMLVSYLLKLRRREQDSPLF